MVTWKVPFLFLIGFMLVGCARVAIFSDPELKTQTGVKFFTPKPYILVAQTKAKDKPTEVSVIYLPDQSKPLYAKTYSGFGSANLALSFNANGTLASLGQTTDTKIPETIGALAALATPGLGALSAVTVAGIEKSATIRSAYVNQEKRIYTKQAKEILKLQTDLNEAIKQNKCKLCLNEIEWDNVDTVIKKLGDAYKLLKNPQIKSSQLNDSISILKEIQAIFDDKLPQSPGLGEQSDALFRAFKTINSSITEILKELSPQPAEYVYKLYEIDNSISPPTLREVKKEELESAPASTQ